MYLMLLEALPIFLKATLYYHQSSLQGAGNRRRMQLSKCVYSQRLTAEHILHKHVVEKDHPCTVYVSCMHHVCLLRYKSLPLLFSTSCCVPNMCYTSPMCVSIDLCVVLQWSVSHGDLTQPQNDTHSAHPRNNSVVFPKDPIKHASVTAL